MPLVTTKEMFRKAYDGGYAIGAFNVNNMEIVQGITEAAREVRAPMILQVSKGARAYANHTYLVKLVEAAVIECPEIPIALHLDHGPDFETCKSCIDGGFTSVMIDASSKPFAENIEITRKVVEYAHDHGVVVEAELGALAGIEDDVQVSAEESHYTHPEEVEEFVSKTGCDSLAIAIGTSHGAYKFTADQCTRNEKGELVPPPLRFDILDEVSKRLPGFPIVLHGSSSVPQEYVKMINENGGKMPDAVGIPEEQLRQAAQLSHQCRVCRDRLCRFRFLFRCFRLRLSFLRRDHDLAFRKHKGQFQISCQPPQRPAEGMHQQRCTQPVGKAARLLVQRFSRARSKECCRLGKGIAGLGHAQRHREDQLILCTGERHI